MSGWMRQKWFPWVVAGVTALLVQVIFVWETAPRVAFAFPLVDSSSYHQLAQALLKGLAPKTPYWQPPLYPWFLAFVYGVFGSSMVVARAAHGLVGVAGVLLTLALGMRLWGRGIGLAAALGVALCGPLLFFETQLLPVALAVVLDLGLVLLVLRAMERPAGWRWLLAGVGLGGAWLAIPNALVMAAVAVPAACLCGGGGWKGRTGRTAAFLAGAALVMAPVAIRNGLVSGQWVLISSNSGINFFIGNNAHREVTVATRPGLDWERLTQLPYQSGAKNAREADGYFWREAGRYIRRQPGSFLKGLAVKGRELLAARELPRNLDVYTMREHSVVLRALTWKGSWFAFPFGLVGPLGLLGLALAWGGGRAQRVTAAFVVVYALSVVLFFPTARYRAPLWPFFWLFAASAAVWMVKRMRVPGPAWWIALGGLGVAALAVNAPLVAPTDRIRFDAELENALGAAFQMRGYGEEALLRYQRALERDTELADAAYNKGVLLGELRRREESMKAYRDVLRLRPDHDKARINLGIALYHQGSLGEAADMLEMATVLNPLNANAWRNRAIVLSAMGRSVEARSCQREAARLGSGNGTNPAPAGSGKALPGG
ncbi:MAG: glycosyltransferase family 39 protein [Kiritimatiellia bacterium]